MAQNRGMRGMRVLAATLLATLFLPALVCADTLISEPVQLKEAGAKIEEDIGSAATEVDPLLLMGVRLSGELPILPGMEYTLRVRYAMRTLLEFNWPSVSEISTYRFRITDDDIDEKKHWDEWILIDEMLSGHSYSLRERELGIGRYTVKAWAVTDAGRQILLGILHLQFYYNQPYDYSLRTPEVSPGTAITRQHALGNKDMTLYTAAKAELPEGAMDSLTLGGKALDVSCGAPFTARLNGDTLTLYADSGTLTATQKALTTLKNSGIARVRLITPMGETALPTDIGFTGRVYAGLRAEGLVSRDFRLIAGQSGILVRVSGRDYTWAEDGTLIPRGEEGA